MNTLRRRWWIPVVVFIGIFLKALLLTPWVSGKAETASIDALQANNIDSVAFVEVDGVSGLGGDGLNVILEGPAAAEVAAVAAVEGRDEVNNVTYRVTDAGTAPATPEPEEAQVPAAPELRAPELSLAADGEQIVLSGSVANELTRNAIVAEAEAQYGTANVTSELAVDAETAGEGGEITVGGELASEVEQADLVAGALAVASAGGLDLIDQTAVRAVEDQLNALFELEPIEFDVNRATIRADSVPTLDAAAEAIIANPGAGVFQVVGHTDGDGPAAFNQQLSEARATAVVAYLTETGGVDPDRLQAIGLGETELLVDPEPTPADKQRNRRIEWRRLP